eukprot:3261651-Pleurochrysis_carterae.AAC.1
MHGKAGYVWVARKNIAFAWDDVKVPWRAFRPEVVRAEGKPLTYLGEEEWLVCYSSEKLDPVDLPVQDIVLGKIA